MVRDYKERLELKRKMVAEMAKVLFEKEVDFVEVKEGLVVKVDEDFVMFSAVVKKADYDLEDAVVEFEDAKAKAAEKAAKAKAKAEKAKAKKAE